MEPKTYYDTNQLIGEWMGIEPSIIGDIKLWPQYHKDWNRLMEAWIRFRDLRFPEVKHQFEHGEFKDLISHSICYSTIEETYRILVNGINWYNLPKEEKIPPKDDFNMAYFNGM